MKRTNPSFAVGAALMLPVLLTGCQHQQLARERLEWRVAGIGDTLETFAHREAQGPEKLARAWTWIEETARDDARQTAANAEELEQFFQRDVDRWEKNQPKYLEAIARQLWGKPERIEENAIRLLY